MGKNLFCLSLLLLFVLSISYVSAAISVKGVYGLSNILGFRAANDTIVINVTSGTDNISVQDLTGQHCVCAKISLGYNCLCQVSDTIDSALATYVIVDDKGQNTQATVKVDDSIGTIDFTPSYSNSTTFINYNIVDTGFSGGADCSGIKSIEVFDGTNSLTTYDINNTISGCNFVGSFPVAITESGDKNFSLNVVDNVGNAKSSAIKKMYIDVSPPIISENDFKLMSSGNELKTTASNTDIPVDISFDVVEQNLNTITLDLSGINTNPQVKSSYKKVVVPISSCVSNISDDGRHYYCVLKNRILRVSNSNGNSNINISVSAIDTSGNTNTVNILKTLTIDDTKPKAQIQTDFCDSRGKCYVKNGINKINVRLDKNNFESKNVFLDVGGSRMRVTNCTGGDCYGYVPINCVSTTVSATILTAGLFVSQDDSGNKIAAYNQPLYCDNNAPTIVSVNFSGYYSDNNGVISGIIMSGSKVTITALLTDDASDELNTSVFLGEMKNSTEKGTCIKLPTNKINCTWTIMSINPGFYNANLHFTFADTIGNSVDKDYTVRVLGVADNDTPRNLGINFIKVYPTSINRVTLDLALTNNVPYFVYAQYTLNVIKGGNKVKLLYQKVDASNCIIKDDDTGLISNQRLFSTVQISNVYAKAGDTNRIDFIFDKIDANAFPDSFSVYCNISAKVQEGDNVYKDLQSLTLQIPMQLRNSKLGTPGEAFEKKIKEEENGFAYKMELVGILNNWLPKIQRICDLRRYFDMASFAGTLVSTIGSAVSPVLGPGIKDGGMAFSINIQSIANCFNGDPRTNSQIFMQATSAPTKDAPQTTAAAAINLGSCPNLVREVCNFVSCSVTEKLEKPGGTPLTDVFSKDILSDDKGILKGTNIPDVSNSVIMAAYARCWPAVVYNLNKWRQVDCGYVYCLKETSLRGTDISTCDQAKHIQQCSLIVGEALELPYLFTGKNYLMVMDNIGEIINNIGPLAAVSLTKKTVCDRYLDPLKPPQGDDFDETKIYLCQIPLQIARFVDGQRRSTRAERFFYPEVTDMCEMAKCAGQPGCQNEPDLYQQLANIRLPDYNQRDPVYTTAENKQYEVYKKQKQELVSSIAKSDPDGANSKTLAQFNSLTPQQISDINIEPDAYKVKYNAELPSGKVLELGQIQNNMITASTLARCGSGLCNKVLIRDPNNPNNQAPVTQEQLANDARLAQLRQEQQIQALDRLEEINKMTQEEIANMDPGPKATLETEKKGIETFLKNCVNGEPGYEQCLKDPIDSKKLSELQQARKEQNTIQQAQQMGSAIQIVLQMMYQNGALNFMMSENWGGSWAKVRDYFDSNKWKNNLCNPEVNIISNSVSDSGSVVSCDGGACKPVLTMAAEKQLVINSSGNNYYIYTVVYYVGPVYLIKGTDVKFRIEFRGGAKTVQGYRNKIVLTTGDVKRLAKVFAHVKEFNQMCIVFDDPYPPNIMGSKGEYCRTIKTNDFDTGSPYVDPQTQQANAAANLPATPFRIYTGAQGSSEPGVLE